MSAWWNLVPMSDGMLTGGMLMRAAARPLKSSVPRVFWKIPVFAWAKVRRNQESGVSGTRTLSIWSPGDVLSEPGCAACREL